jgi:putative addiction module component (TIGR02574 family)
MLEETSKLLDEAKKLPPSEKAELIEKLLDSFDTQQRDQIEEAWVKEAESRLDAYEAGLIEGIPISKVFEEIEHKDLK